LAELGVLHQRLITQQLDKELSSYHILQDMVRLEKPK
jgi:hypothetical protein